MEAGLRRMKASTRTPTLSNGAVGSYVAVGEEESDSRDEKITPADMDIGEKMTQWSPKEALGQLCPLVFHVPEPCEMCKGMSLYIGECVCVCVCVCRSDGSVYAYL